MEREQISTLIKNELENMAGKSLPNSNDEIFKSGYLDSLNVLNIIVFLEQKFHITINPYDINIDNLGTLNSIVQYVEDKIQV
jgi:acyl carrier protein